MGAALTLALFVASLIGEDRRFPSEQALADAIGVAQSRINRVRRGELTTLNAFALLRLANVTDTDPGVVLRLGGKEAWAREIEDLYGPAPGLPFAKRRFMERVTALTEGDRQAVEMIVERLERALRRER